MNKHGSCCERKASTGCHTSRAIQGVQPFPEHGLLTGNLNLPFAVLVDCIREVRGRAYSYVVRSVKLDRSTTRFEQHGSAPNFQGDVLTLCTCKHQMRSRQSADEWQNNVWIAGFTSRTIRDGEHWLFYLAKIESAYESHSDLWNGMDASSREAKVAHVHFLGDMYKPKKSDLSGIARYSPSRYYTPSIHVHRQHRSDNGWRNDISYGHADRYRHPPLLVADPHMTFLWEEPMISLNQGHCRNYFKWTSLKHMIDQLREAG